MSPSFRSIRLVLAPLCAVVLLAALVAIAGSAAETQPAADSYLAKRHRDIERVQELAVVPEAESPQPAPGPSGGTQRLLVRLREDAQPATVASLPGEASVEHSYENIPWLAVQADQDVEALLEAHPGVVEVIPDGVAHFMLSESVPHIDGDLAWAAGADGTGQTVAVIDTGVDTNHEMFAGKTITEACFSVHATCPNGQMTQVGPGAAAPPCPECGTSHGTGVAGIAVGDSPTLQGVAPGADLVAISVASYGWFGLNRRTGIVAQQSDILAALDHVATLADTIDIASVNLSLGWASTGGGACDASYPHFTDAIELLDSKGVAVAAAVGNFGSRGQGWLAAPACISTVTNVGASTLADVPAWFTNAASELDLFAPGTDIDTARWPGGGTVSFSGTSASAPHVAGAFAVLGSADPSLDPQLLRSALISSGTPMSTAFGDIPRIDVDDALALVTAGSAPSIAIDDGYITEPDTSLSVAAAAGMVSDDVAADGLPLTVDSVTQPANGTLNHAADGSFSYTPDAGFVGRDTFTYVARDSAGFPTEPATVSVVVNSKPVGGPDSFTISQGERLIVWGAELFGNDSDPDGDAFIEAAVRLYPDEATVGRVYLDDLRYGFAPLDRYQLEFIPRPGFTGQAYLEYVLIDALGRTSDPVPVTIDVTPAPQRASEAANFRIDPSRRASVETDLANTLAEKWSVSLTGHVGYPLVVDGGVYFTESIVADLTDPTSAREGFVHGYDPTTGEALFAPVHYPASEISSLAYADGRLFLTIWEPNPGDPTTNLPLIVGLDAATGAELWRSNRGHGVFLTTYDGILYTDISDLDPATGAWASGYYTPGAGYPAYTPESFYEVSTTSPCLVRRWDRDGVYIDPRWSYQDTDTAWCDRTPPPEETREEIGYVVPRLHYDSLQFPGLEQDRTLNATSGAAQVVGDIGPPAAFDFDTGYYVLGGELRAIDSTGEQWSFAGQAPITASPIVVDGRVVTADSLGNVYLIDPQGNLLWSDHAGAPVLETREYSDVAVPDPLVVFQTGTAAANGTLVVPTEDGIVAYGNVIETGSVTADATPQTIDFASSFKNPVVVTTPNRTAGSAPAAVRVTNVTSDGFDLYLQELGGGAVTPASVDYIVVEEGVWDIDGVRFEAVRYDSTVTDRRGSWTGETRTYGQSYTNPVVVGQVMSANDPDFSVFWSSGASRTSPPTATDLTVGKHVGEDPDQDRANEEVGYIVFEAGRYSLGGSDLEAGVGADTVKGIDNAPPYQYAFSSPFAATPTAAIASIAGMDGGNGGFATTYGTAATPTQLRLAVAEDNLRDGEERHGTEQVAYLVVE